LFEFPHLISPLAEEFKVGSMLTHINEACVCKSHNVPTLLAGDVLLIAFVNNYEAREAVKNNPTISFGQQVSLAKNGFYARGHFGRAAVLTIVSDEFNRVHAVSVGDLLLSVGGVSTTLMNAVELEAVLISDFVSFEVIKKVAFEPPSRQTYATISQSWDYANPCVHCGYIYLVADTNRNQCCMNGRALDDTYFPPLLPMPPELNHLALNRIEHMNSNSTYYNNLLALGAVGVDNGKGGGYEKLVGDHALKLNGRTYHFLPKTGGSGGLEYFTFDAGEALLAKGVSLNKESKRGEHIKATNLHKLFEELKQTNCHVHDCEQIGRGVTQIVDPANEEEVRVVIAQLNTQTSSFDVAAITSDRTTGERTLTYKLKGAHKASRIPISHRLMEPLSYPLLFPYGKVGWDTLTGRDLHFGDYLLSRMLMPEKSQGFDQDPVLLYSANKAKTHQLPVNRFQLMARLGQIFSRHDK